MQIVSGLPVFFMLLAGSLWVLVGGGVACLERASRTGRLSDSRYVLILDFNGRGQGYPL